MQPTIQLDTRVLNQVLQNYAALNRRKTFPEIVNVNDWPGVIEMAPAFDHSNRVAVAPPITVGAPNPTGAVAAFMLVAESVIAAEIVSTTLSDVTVI